MRCSQTLFIFRCWRIELKELGTMQAFHSAFFFPFHELSHIWVEFRVLCFTRALVHNRWRLDQLQDIWTDFLLSPNLNPIDNNKSILNPFVINLACYEQPKSTGISFKIQILHEFPFLRHVKTHETFLTSFLFTPKWFANWILLHIIIFW